MKCASSEIELKLEIMVNRHLAKIKILDSFPVIFNIDNMNMIQVTLLIKEVSKLIKMN